MFQLQVTWHQSNHKQTRKQVFQSDANMDVLLKDMLKLPYFKLEVVFSKAKIILRLKTWIFCSVCERLCVNRLADFDEICDTNYCSIQLVWSFGVFQCLDLFLHDHLELSRCVKQGNGQRNCLDIVTFWTRGQCWREGQQSHSVLYWQHKSPHKLMRTWSIFSFSANKKHYSVMVFCTGCNFCYIMWP